MAQVLLKVPAEAIRREQREAIMGNLISRTPAKLRDVTELTIRPFKQILSLMVKLFKQPTFYPVERTLSFVS
jgi:hypothetical protein